MTEENPPAGVDELTAILLPIVQDRITRLGEHDSGAYNFYASRARQQRIFSDYDVALARAILSRDLPVTGIHEVGAGFGQLSFLLGWNGTEIVGIDRDERTYRTGALLLEKLRLAAPEVAARIRFIGAPFPLRPETGFLGYFTVSPNLELTRDAFCADWRLFDTAGALVMTTNLVATPGSEGQLGTARAMRRYRFALVDVDRFFEPANTAAERERVFALFKEAGFTTAEPFLDIGASGCYYLFGHEDEPRCEAVPPAVDLGAFGNRLRLLLSDWVNESPDHERGAGRYYLDKLARGVLFESYDIAVAQYAERHLPPAARFCELGSGFGELCILLALKGFRCLGIEVDAMRCRGAAAVLEALPRIGVHLPALSFIEGRYPDSLGLDRLSGEDDNVLVATNVTSGEMMARMGHILASLRLFDHLLINVSRFGAVRDAAMTNRLVAQLQGLGFVELGEVYRGGDVDVRHFGRAPRSGAGEAAEPARPRSHSSPERPENPAEAMPNTLALDRGFEHELGKCWLYRLGAAPAAERLATLADSEEHPSRSPVSLVEDGKPLGPAHAIHALIRSAGRGAYSHWGDTLYLSTSDNSDPNTNRRRYELAWS